MRGNTFNNAEILAELTKLEDGVRTVEVQVDGPLDCNDGNLLHQGTLEGLGLQWRSLWEIRSVEHLSQTIFVGDRLLNESGLEKHPLNPMTDPDIRR